MCATARRPPLILASTSPFRGELLLRLGLKFEQDDPQLDEEPWKAQGLSPEALVSQLAQAKAAAVATQHPDALVLGADQVVSFEGDVLGKPGSFEAAVEQLRRLQGRTHELVTGVALLDGRDGTCRTEVMTHQVTVRSLDSEAIERYVERDSPEQCAGSYKVESLGITLFERL
ncbi:MAG TPA: septum formation protein Maf, partial [Deltaproteobacteria bacterium]|nr:septum formation protein Maf [Deltaproteobacteria bacterium]